MLIQKNGYRTRSVHGRVVAPAECHTELAVPSIVGGNRFVNITHTHTHTDPMHGVNVCVDMRMCVCLFVTSSLSGNHNAGVYIARPVCIWRGDDDDYDDDDVDVRVRAGRGCECVLYRTHPAEPATCILGTAE